MAKTADLEYPSMIPTYRLPIYTPYLTKGSANCAFATLDLRFFIHHLAENPINCIFRTTDEIWFL